MKISKNGIDFIKRMEGLKLEVYSDSAGLPTIGYGHLIKKNENFITITEEIAEKLLIDDLVHAEQCINTNVKVTLNQNQFDALVSFVFNIGCNRFKTSTLLKKLNENNMIAASLEFLRWNKVTDMKTHEMRIVEGLKKRRENEKNLFLLRD